MRANPRLKALATCTLAAFALLPFAAHAATTLTVGNCNDAGNGSLRAAVTLANATSGDVTIDVSHLACSRITLTTGALATTNPDLTLQGPGASKLRINGNYTDRVITHISSGPIFIYDLTIAGGKSTTQGGCFYSNSGAALHRTDVRECEIVGTGDVRGGAIYSKGILFVDRGTVDDTIAYSSGGTARGGAISAGTVLLSEAIVSNGYAQGKNGAFGGGVSSTSILAFGSLITANRAEEGGGVFIESGGTGQIKESTVSGNSASQCGGGIYSKYDVKVSNSTIAFNTARRVDSSRACAGGGLYSALAAKSVELYSSILANNFSYDASSMRYASDFGAQINMSSNTIAGDHNIIVGVDAGSRAPPTGTLRGDPRLAPLRGNGGRSPTHALLPASPAIDHGSNPDADGTDQRGQPRTLGGGIDIGAFEHNPDVIFTNGFD